MALINRHDSEVDVHAEVVEETAAAGRSFQKVVDLGLEQNAHR